jgi:hypothetical protein
MSALHQDISSSTQSIATNIINLPISNNMTDAAVTEVPVGTVNEELGSIIQDTTSPSQHITTGSKQNNTVLRSCDQLLDSGVEKFTPTAWDRLRQRQDPSKILDDMEEQDRQDREAKQAMSVFLSDADLLSTVDL